MKKRFSRIQKSNFDIIKKAERENYIYIGGMKILHPVYNPKIRHIARKYGYPIYLMDGTKNTLVFTKSS